MCSTNNNTEVWELHLLSYDLSFMETSMLVLLLIAEDLNWNWKKHWMYN